ncbi:MAG TPA: phospholipase D family protein [Candidatus Binatia bacterium]|nr:phospholipase D family protein [Candidatus Binatia bacterium]
MRCRLIASAVAWSLGFCLAGAFAAEMVVQACFSPQGNCSAHILREIDGAKKELLVAVYAFTNDELAQALVRAKKRGVAVQVVVDREFDLANENSKGKFLEAQKIPLRRVSGAKAKSQERDAGLMHQKFAVIDRRVILTGSYNWTRSADLWNDENLLLFRDAGPLAEEYRNAFFRLWERKS